jgi:hypothetical protein
MTRTLKTETFSKKIRKYLKEKGYPYLLVADTDNLLVLRSEGEYHYLAIQFESFPDGWFHERRHFKIKVAYGNNYEQLVNAIERYFNLNQQDNGE